MTASHHYACDSDPCCTRRATLADTALDTGDIMVDLPAELVYVPDVIIAEGAANGHTVPDDSAVLQRDDGRAVYVFAVPDAWRAAA